jgi:hypothetical protein
MHFHSIVGTSVPNSVPLKQRHYFERKSKIFSHGASWQKNLVFLENKRNDYEATQNKMNIPWVMKLLVIPTFDSQKQIHTC